VAGDTTYALAGDLSQALRRAHAWRNFAVSDYSDAGQERWLAEHGTSTPTSEGVQTMRADRGRVRRHAAIGRAPGRPDARREQLTHDAADPGVVGPADIAALAVYLMTNTAVTGATFDIDGGQQLIEG